MDLLFRMLFKDCHDLLATLAVRILLCLTSVPITDTSELIHKISEIRIRLLHDQARQSNTHLGRVVSTEYRTVLDKSHLTTQSSRGKSSTASRDTATNHNKIKFLLKFGCRLWCTHLCQCRLIQLLAARQVDCIASAIKASKVMKSDDVLSLVQLHLSCILPMPLSILCSKYIRSRFAIDKDLEFTGRLFSSPCACPVSCTDPHMVSTTLFRRNSC